MIQSAAQISVSEYWDQFVGTHLNSPDHWEANQVTQQFQWSLICGDPFKNPVDWFMEKYGPFNRMASICAGSGLLEKYVAANYCQNSVALIEGYDISPKSIELAKQNAKGLRGIAYHVGDANKDVWEANYLDAAFAHGALHHIKNLDHCLGELRKALKPSGYLYVNDYMGPRRFQWTDAQLRMARDLFKIVPKRFRRNGTIDRTDPVALNEMDPSEAVRSDQILEHISTHFEIIVRVDRGGTLLGPIFGSGCIAPAIFETEEGMRIVQDMCQHERHLIDAAIIPANHVLVVAKPRPIGLGQSLASATA